VKVEGEPEKSGKVESHSVIVTSCTECTVLFIMIRHNFIEFINYLWKYTNDLSFIYTCERVSNLLINFQIFHTKMFLLIILTITVTFNMYNLII
jgi:hypothetical protein